MNSKDFLFNDNQEFEKYVAKTSFYTSTQNAVCKIVKAIEPNYLLELGSGNGNTSVRIARENSRTSIVAVDIRQNMVGLGEERSKFYRLKNLTFVCGDLTKLDNFNMKNVNAVLLLYSFKYISDPNSNKKDFLSSLYNSMQKGARVIIGDTFLNNEKTFDKNAVHAIYETRAKEAYDSSFWNHLESISKSDIKNLIQVAEECENKVLEQEVLAQNRETIYLVNSNWLCEVAKEIGFDVELCNRVNSCNDYVIVLKK